MNNERKRIGERLIDHGYISRHQLEEGLRIQETRDEKICNILFDLGHLGESDFLEFLSSVPGTASVQLSSCELSPEILEMVPAELAHRLELVPIGTIGKVLTVAMVCPLDTMSRRELENATGLKVRPVLCSRSSLITTLEKYYGRHETDEEEPEEPCERDAAQGLLESLKLSGVARLIEEIEDLPTLPDIVQRVSEIAGDPNSSAADLAEVIATDGSISAKLLRLANSPAFGFSRQISRVKDAVALLGFTETKALVTSVAVLGFLADGVDLDFRTYWNHSFTCATLSRLIAQRLGTGGVEIAFVAGLLHDVGKMALAMKLPGKRTKIVELRAETGMTELQAEEAVLGLNHAEIGYQLGEHWLLPPDLTAAIRAHHTPEPDSQPTDIARVVYLANILCKIPPSDLEGEIDFDANIRDVLELLQLSERELNEALNDFAKTALDIPTL